MNSNKFISFFSDREYYGRLIQFGLPIAAQQLIFTSLNLVSNIMVGQLGETTVAAVSLAGQIFFLFNLLVFGIGSGAAMFTAQLWGKRDIPNIQRVLGLALSLSTLSSLVFVVIAELFPQAVLGIYSKDALVVAVGSSYLRIFGVSFFFFGVTATFSLVLRSIGQVRLPVLVSITALLVNIILSYLLIFGKLGFPALGANGAALSIVISRILECLALVILTYWLKLPVAARLGALFSYTMAFAGQVLKPILPVAINEILWSFGITAYQVIYARIGTEQLAAVNIATTISDMVLFTFFGIANATAIMVGNTIGSGGSDKAQVYSGRSLVLGAGGGLVIGLLVLLLSPLVLSLYEVSDSVIDYTQSMLLINCSFMWLRMMNLILFIGVFRAGGDTRFALLLDGLIIWLVGVPLTAFGAFVLHWPIYLVYALTLSEELVKWSLGVWRFRSRRWIHDLTKGVNAEVPI